MPLPTMPNLGLIMGNTRGPTVHTTAVKVRKGCGTFWTTERQHVREMTLHGTQLHDSHKWGSW